jgi:toxin-antitoxin system PIN domain toxin
MILMDVNSWSYAHREDTPDHPAYRDWGEDTINSGRAYGVSELVLRGFMRVVTPLQVFERPTPLAVALDFVNQIRGQPHAAPLRPGPRHWAIFYNLLRASDATGNLVPDAYHAALAIESGCDWITIDKGFLCITYYRILLANPLQSSRSTFSRGSLFSFFAFKEGMLGTPISVLGG